MGSSITLTFNDYLRKNDFLSFKNTIINQTINILYSDFNSPYEIQTTNDINQDIINTYNFLQNVYNVSNIYTISRDISNKKIIISSNNANFFINSNLTSGRITTNIINEPVIIPIKITSIDVIENSENPCNLFDFTITTSKQATKITSPVNQVVTTNPFTITGVTRDSVNDIIITVEDDNSSNTDSIFIPKINSSTFDLNISLSPTGGSIIALYNLKPTELKFQYSLDNINWYNSSSFSNLEEGNYTLYIRDNIGCSNVTKNFEITAFEPNVYVREPYFKVSQQNSFISVLRDNNLPNPTNTLSYEEEGCINARNFMQLYQKNDGVITQQYRSNYEDVEIKLINCKGEEQTILPTKKTSNFNITDVRDVSILKVNYLGAEYVGVQYVVGDTYDPDTLQKNGDYNLGSEVPDFMNVDDYIQIEGAGWYKVINVQYINNIETLILQAPAVSFPISLNITVKGTSVYNLLPYEVYEYSIDLYNIDGSFKIKYKATDSEFETIEELTEWISVKEHQKDTYLLVYYNSENNETNYSTGIVNKLRLPYETTLTYLPNDTQDVYFTDTNAVTIENTYRDLYSLELKFIPMGMVRKVGLAISNDRLFINGLSLLKNSEMEVERQGNSNLYKVTLQFVRSDYAFTNIASDGSIILPTGVPIFTDGLRKGFLITK